jgi:hypothetical protein
MTEIKIIKHNIPKPLYHSIMLLNMKTSVQNPYQQDLKFNLDFLFSYII